MTKVNNNSFEALMQDGTTVTVPWSGMSWARPYRSANSVGAAPSRASQIVKVKDIVRLRPNENKSSWALVQTPQVQGQLIALNPNNGAIEAIVGGYNFINPNLTVRPKAGVSRVQLLNPSFTLWL